MKIIRGLKAAAKALTAGPRAELFNVGGKLVTCAHCGNSRFHKTKASLNRAFSSLAGTEWLDKEASILICANCSKIEWFISDLRAEET